VATLTYVYAESTAMVGPLAQTAEPHSYDLCDSHALTLTAPRGWQLVRPEEGFAAPPPLPDDVFAVADAVDLRGARVPDGTPERPRRRVPRPGAARGHLRLLPPATG
jgi:hypothetical protein